MFRKLLNNKLIQNYTQYLRKIENGVNISNQITKWNGQQFKAYSTAPVNKLFSLQNPKKDKELKAIQIKVALHYEEGSYVPNPNDLTPEHWEHLLTLPTEGSRRCYLEYINSKLSRKKKQKVKNEIRAENRAILYEKRTEEINNNKHIAYGLHRNTLFLRINPLSVRRWQNKRLFRAMRFNPQLIFDCSYDQYMTIHEAKNTGKQLSFCFAANRKHVKPYDIHMCNVDCNGPTMQGLQKWIPTMYNKSFPLQLHEKCFTELFPREKLVYLTPHSTELLEEFNPNDIYIIGGFVDKGVSEPISLAKAKAAGIRVARLPIERFLRWGTGTKYLSLDQLCKIMLDLMYTRDWNKALSHIPRRKLY